MEGARGVCLSLKIQGGCMSTGSLHVDPSIHVEPFILMRKVCDSLELVGVRGNSRGPPLAEVGGRIL